MRSSSTWGAKRATTCSTMGLPRNGCSPLSTPPMRLPWPPARTTPVTSAILLARGEIRLGGAFHEPLRPREQEIVLPDCASDHRDPHLLRDLVAHLREAR